MKKGTKVSWQVLGQTKRGLGVVRSDEDECGGVLVSVQTLGDEPFPGYHPVIYCTVTWLTVETGTASESN